jgi:C-terminal processing protease CtpA/Prc
VRRSLVIVFTALVAFGVSFALGLTRPAVLARLSPHLPAWVQTRPSIFLQSALSIIRSQAARRDALDWPAVANHANDLAKDAKTAADTYPAIRYALEQLNDGHSMLIPPATGAAPAGVYGFQTLFPDKVVAVVYPDSAAAKAGIRPGDLIEMVNGAPPIASQDARARGVFVNIPPPSATLRLRHPGDRDAHDVSLSIGPYLPLPALTRRLGGDLGYVEIPGTSGQDQFAERVRESVFQADAPTVCGWIVDLRFNNGGSLWAMLQALRPILGEGPFGSFAGPDGRQRSWAYPTTGSLAVPAPEHPLQHPDGPVAVLTSRLTSGSGEVASIAFRGRPGTRVFGEPTWGAPTENTFFALPDGAGLDLATSKAADRARRVYEGRLPPDEVVAIDWARLAAIDDPVVIAAGTWLRAQPGCGAIKK